MSVKGFDEVLSKAITINIDDFEIKIASLHGLFLLKLNAWLDRSIKTNKDAEDIWYIVDNYYMANENRGIHPEVYSFDNFELSVAGAYWMAYDIADMLSKQQISFYLEAIKKEAELEEDSRLVTQIVGTKPSVSSEEIVRVLMTVVDVFTKRLQDD